jgi:hypothetical protein
VIIAWAAPSMAGSTTAERILTKSLGSEGK